MRNSTLLGLIVSVLAAPVWGADTTPYFASIKSDKIYMRLGPGEEYPIKWVYHRKGLPWKYSPVTTPLRRASNRAAISRSVASGNLRVTTTKALFPAMSHSNERLRFLLTRSGRWGKDMRPNHSAGDA